MGKKSNATKKWKDSGLLEGLPKHKAELVANAFEVAANYMVYNSRYYNSGPVDVMVFPVIRRILENEKIKEINVKNLYNKLTKEYNLVKKNWVKPDYDYELEFVVKFCKKYINNEIKIKKAK